MNHSPPSPFAVNRYRCLLSRQTTGSLMTRRPKSWTHVAHELRNTVLVARFIAEAMMSKPEPSPSPSEGASEVPKEIKLLFWRIMEYSQRPDQGVLVLRDELAEQTRELRAELGRVKPHDVSDGFGSTWPPCSKHNRTMDIMRPGDARCAECETESYIERINRERNAAESSLREKEQENAELRRRFLDGTLPCDLCGKPSGNRPPARPGTIYKCYECGFD